MQRGTMYGLVLVCFCQASSLHVSMVYGLDVYRHTSFIFGETLGKAKVSGGMEDTYAPWNLVESCVCWVQIQGTTS